MSNKTPKVTYTGAGTQIGLFFKKSLKSGAFCSFATRAKDGEVTFAVKKVPPVSLPNTFVGRIINQLNPQPFDTDFRKIVQLELEENNGKIRPDIDLAKKMPKDKVAAPMLIPLIMAAYAVLPMPLVFLLDSSVTTNIIAAIIPPLVIIALIFGSFAAFAKDIIPKYHAAEHMSIACLEAGDELTIRNIRKYSRISPKCGTAFLTTVWIASGVFASCFLLLNNIYTPSLGLLIRSLSFPISYLIMFGVFKVIVNSENPLLKALINIICAPGLFLQYAISTKDPDDEQLEVAIVGLKALNALK